MLRWRRLPVININSLRIDYSDAGLGVPIVFVPGLSGSREWFRYQTSGLSDHYRIISYNLRRAHLRTKYTLDLLADDLAKFLDALHIPSAVIAGHSFGGLVALQFAVSHPDRCPALVLCSTSPSFSGIPDEELLAHLLPGEVKFDNLFIRLWKKLFGSKRAGEDDVDSLDYSRFNAGLDRATLDARLKILRKTNLTPLLGTITMPSLIVAGSLDEPYILAGSQLLDQMIPDSTLEVIENTDHFCFCTRHDLFNATLVEYLSHKVARL